MPRFGASRAPVRGSTGNAVQPNLGHPLPRAVQSPLTEPVSTFVVALLKTLTEHVDESVRHAIRQELPQAIQTATRPEYMSRAEAAEYARLSIRSIDHLRKTRKLGWTKRGGRVMIKTADLDTYLGEGYVRETVTKERGV